MTTVVNMVDSASQLKLLLHGRTWGILRYIPQPDSDDNRGIALLDIFDIQPDGTVDYKLRSDYGADTDGWGNKSPRMHFLENLKAGDLTELIKSRHLRPA